MLKKTILSVAFFALIAVATQAQRGIDYKTYSIQIASYSKVLDDVDFNKALKRFSNLTDLGYIYETSFLSPTNVIPSKFFIGSYVGMHTAKAVLAQVKKRGYKDAYIVEEYKASDPLETTNHLVVQIGSSRKLYMDAYKKLSDGVGQGYVNIALGDDGKYKVLLTCFKDNNTDDELMDAKQFKYPVWVRDIRDVYKLKTAAKK